jgi:SnoaL-like domain
MIDAASSAYRTAAESAAGWAAVPSPEVAVELQNLMQAYALLTDEGREPELAALFWPDAVWDGRELDYGIATGPQSIAKLVLTHFDPARPVVHLPGPPLLTAVSDREVEGVCWCLATRLVDGRTDPMIYFYYHDLMRSDAHGRWRFAHRYLRLRFRAAPASTT